MCIYMYVYIYKASDLAEWVDGREDNVARLLGVLDTLISIHIRSL